MAATGSSCPLLGQRLVRAKRKIRDARIAFAGPDPAEAPDRHVGVLSAIDAAYGAAWDDAMGAAARLIGFAPTTGVMVARAVAHAENGASGSALGQLHAMTGIETYQPWWAALARVKWLAGDAQGSAAATATAAGLSADPAIRAFLFGGGYRFEASSSAPGEAG